MRTFASARNAVSCRAMRDDEIRVEGQPDSKPYKLYRVTSGGQSLGSAFAEYVTLDEAKNHRHRADQSYAVFFRRKKVWRPGE